MNVSKLLGMLALSWVSTSFAVTCYVTFIKDQCYADYNVHLSINDSHSKRSLVELDLPQSKFWIRQAFDCQPNQVVTIASSFTPAIWEADAGKQFFGTHFTQFPDIEPPQGTIWAMDVCFPSQFSKVPSPPKITGTCGCDKTSIPPLNNPNIINS